MQTVSYNDLTKRAQGIVIAATKKGLYAFVKPAKRGWEVFYDGDIVCPIGFYPVVDIPATNNFTQQTVALSQDAQNWIKAMKETLPVLTESEIVSAALQHYALFINKHKQELLELADDPLFTSEYEAEILEQWQNETEAAIE